MNRKKSGNRVILTPKGQSNLNVKDVMRAVGEVSSKKIKCGPAASGRTLTRVVEVSSLSSPKSKVAGKASKTRI